MTEVGVAVHEQRRRLGAQPRVGLGGGGRAAAPACQQRPDAIAHRLRAQRLDQVVGDAERHQPAHHVLAALVREDDNRQVTHVLAAADRFDHFDPVQTRQVEVQHRQIERTAREQVERLHAVFAVGHCASEGRRQPAFDDEACGRVVFADQHVHRLPVLAGRTCGRCRATERREDGARFEIGEGAPQPPRTHRRVGHERRLAGVVDGCFGDALHPR